MKKHFSIHVYGRVQGVYFRASTKEKADSLGIDGFVRNQPDGSVYIEAEGNEETLDAFVAWCRKGPSHAVVERCEVTEAAPKNFSGFVIQR